MNNKFLRTALMAIIFLAPVAMILVGSTTTTMTTAYADDQIPDWIRDVAGFWADGIITDSEFIEALEFLIESRVITVSNDMIQKSESESHEEQIIWGTVTKNIDGNTIEISGERIRLPFVNVKDSGNKDTDHAAYARQLCPIGSAAGYDIDDDKPVGKYGRTIAMVYCEDQTKSLDQLMVESGLGQISSYWCEKSEFRTLDWVNGCLVGGPENTGH